MKARVIWCLTAGGGVIALGIWLVVRLELDRRPPAVAPKAFSSAVDQPVGPSRTNASAEPQQILYPQVVAGDSDEQLLQTARDLVAGSPQKAVAFARSQTNSILRRRLLFAVIRAWGEKDPDTAIDWVLLQNDDERRTDMEAALAGAVKQPQVALAIVQGLLKYYDPSDSIGAGPALVVALNNAGQFQTALDFLQNASADSRTNLTTATFRCWGETRPQDALEALNSITNGQLRKAAFRAMADGWSQNDPSNLAVYANSMPAGEDRAYALKKAFDNWSLQDPETMAAWLSRQPSGPEFDQAAALMLSKIDSANCTPEIAMSWVKGIHDPTLKLYSFVQVLGEWNQANPAAARQYAATASWLDPQQRQSILKALQNQPPNEAGNGG